MLGEQDRFDRLIYDDLFSFFPRHIRSNLLSKATARAYKAGEPIFQKGEEGPWLAAILSGRVRICIRSSDKEMLISILERGEICGERAVFDGLLRAGDAFAEEDTACLIFKREDLVPALYSCPDAMMYIIKIMCSRSVRYMNTMELYAMQSLPVRLANFLLFLGQRHGVNKDGTISLHLNISQTDLSQQIASSRESINRQMKAFAALGLIDIDSDGITITDVTGLKNICGDTTKD